MIRNADPSPFPGSRRSRNILTLTLQLRWVSPGPEPCQERGAVTIPPSQTIPKFPGFGAFSHRAAHEIPAVSGTIISKEFLSKELYPIWDPLWDGWEPSVSPGMGAGLTPCSGSFPGNVVPEGRNETSSTAPSPPEATDPSWEQRLGITPGIIAPRDLLALSRFPFHGAQNPIDPKSHHPIHPSQIPFHGHKFPFHGHKFPFHRNQIPIPWDTNSHSPGHKFPFSWDTNSHSIECKFPFCGTQIPIP